MSLKKALPLFLGVILIMMFFHHTEAQMKKVHKFKKVNFPLHLKHKDMTIEKGNYDLEIMAYRAVRQWGLKILKKGNTICMVPGEILRDECPGARGEKMEDIPEDPTLKMSRMPAKHAFFITFEAGKLTQFYTCYKVRFQMEYE